MTPLPSYFSRVQQSVPMLARATRAATEQATAQGGAEPGTDQQRREVRSVPPERGVSAETMARVVSTLRRVAGGETGGDGLAAEARQLLVLLDSRAPIPAEARRARLNVVA